MEYADIKDRHLIVYGKDIVSNLKIDKCHLRLQCESETKNLLIRLRQGYIANLGNKNLLQNLIINSNKTLMAILKTILRLNSTDKIPANKREIIQQSSGLIELDYEFLLQTLEGKIQNQNFVIQKFIDLIYDILAYVDKIEICEQQ